MNIRIPDSWLREHLDTKATPVQIKEYLSLCGPSIERISDENGELIYDIEVTGNRPDAMSVIGIAREASVILPRFDLEATLVQDPYRMDSGSFAKQYSKEGTKKLSISTLADLNPRWSSIVISGVNVTDSPDWLKKKLAATGIRPINTIVDITNYLMRTYGQPAHAFDYDSIGKKNGIPLMKLRASEKGETLVTLDGKTHTLPGDDIVIEDGEGNLIDLCGIMGAANSAITRKTTSIILFLQTYDHTHIRKTSMRLSHRTEAAGLFEKGVDSELVLPVLMEGVRLTREITGGTVASKLYDINPEPFLPYTVAVDRHKVNTYLGTSLPEKTLMATLTPLGLATIITKNEIVVEVPSFRRDIGRDVDIIEEIARIYGYQSIASRLPDAAPPVVLPDATLTWEERIKTRLRDWGYTELYTYSMISKEQMDIFGFDTSKTYKIANPLTNEWVYLRPSLQPGVLEALRQNLNNKDSLKLFELSKIYRYRPGNLPDEEDVLIAVFSGDNFFEAKGLAESLFDLFGVTPDTGGAVPMERKDEGKRQSFGAYGSVGLVRPDILAKLAIHKPVTVLDLSIAALVRDAKVARQYTPVPKFPPVVEDLAFTVPDKFESGPLISELKSAHPLVTGVSLLDIHENTRTFHITYQDPEKNLTGEEIIPVRKQLIALAEEKFSVRLKTA